MFESIKTFYKQAFHWDKWWKEEVQPEIDKCEYDCYYCEKKFTHGSQNIFMHGPACSTCYQNIYKHLKKIATK